MKCSLQSCAIALQLILAVAWSPVAAQSQPRFDGRLYRAVAEWGTANPFTVGDRERVPVALRPSLERFMRCHSTFVSRLPKPDSFFATAALNKQRALERALACLSDHAGIADLATRYARDARILYEWEGMASSPLEEADFAEAYITSNVASPLAPYLYLFTAARVRCAFEFYARDGDSAEIMTMAARYRRLLERARNADPFVRLIADDMDGMRFLVSDVGRHPRDAF
jgi:hypothetical protein